MQTHRASERFHLLPGYTIVELLVAAGIFIVLATLALSVYVNVFGANVRTDADRQLQDETVFAFESLVKSIRNSVIDFPEYRRWAVRTGATSYDHDAELLSNNALRSTYETYNAQAPGTATGLEAILGDEDMPNDSVAQEYFPGLVLLSPDGTTRKRYRWRPDALGGGQLTVSDERLVCFFDDGTGMPFADDAVTCDDFGDEQSWAWIDAEAADCTAADLLLSEDHQDCRPVERVITTDRLAVTMFSFALTPARDPFFAYEDASVQVQPAILLAMQTETSPDAPHGPGSAPKMDLSTAVSIRTYADAQWNPTIIE